MTAQEHADTLRNDLRRAKERLFPGTWEKYRCRVSVDGKALDALLKEVERLTAERDAISAARHRWQVRAEDAERERDELLIERGEWDSWKNHAEACQRERDEAVQRSFDWRKEAEAQQDLRLAAEALAEQRCIAHAAVTVMHGDCPICDLEAAEALAERRGEALRQIKPLVTGDLPPLTPLPMTMRCVRIADIVDAALADEGQA